MLAPTFTITTFSEMQNHVDNEKMGEAHKWVPVYRRRKSLLNFPQRREGKKDEEKERRKGGRKREEQRERKGVRIRGERTARKQLSVSGKRLRKQQ